jgi:iron(III) transport system permease protein
VDPRRLLGHARDGRARAGRARSRGQRAPWWLVVPSVVAALIALLPVWYLVVRAGSLAEVWEVLGTVSTLRLTIRSLVLTGLVTVLATAIGVGAAWLVARTDLPGRRFWAVAMVLPLAVPSYVGAFVWIEAFPSLAGLPGAVLVLTLVTFPYVFLPTLAALQGLDPAHEEVAASLGHGRAATAWRVTVRQVRPSIAAGALLVALYALSDFGAVALMRYEVFTWVIYGAYRSGFDPTRAAVLSLLLVALAVGLVLWEARIRGRAGVRTGAGVARRGRQVHLGHARVPAILGLSTVLGAAVVVPAISIAAWSVTGAADVLDRAELASAITATVVLAGLSAAACVVLAVPVGVLAARHPGATSLLLERATFAGHALPGIVVAIAMVYVGVTLLRPIYQQAPVLVLGYVVLFLPLAVVGARTAVEAVPVRAEEVARALGSTRATVLRRVTLPVAAPGIAAAAVMVLLSTMKELPVTLLLHPTGTETLATELWHHMLISDRSAAAPYMALIVLGAALPSVVLGRVGRMRSQG